MTTDNLYSYLGYFDTDPNRVLDMLLLSLDMNCSLPDEILQGYITVIKHFKTSAIVHLLGYKLMSVS